MHSEFELIAQDGTKLVAWKNHNTDGPPVLVCNGMGVPPEAWPRLLDPSCEYAVAGWNHRGALGSERPSDPSHIEIEHHVQDAVDLMDAMGWDKAVVVGWSLGVNVAYELAAMHPERVSGLLGIAGVPGGTFDTLFAPQFVPRFVRKPLGLGVVKAGRALAPGLNFLARTVPTGRPFAEVLRHTGFVLPHADHEVISQWATSMVKQDFEWYFELAIALAKHEEFDASFIECPVTVVAGSLDMLTSGGDVLRAASRIRHAEVHRLPGTHCLPLEFPDQIQEMLQDLYARASWREALAEARDAAGVAADPITDGDISDAFAQEEEEYLHLQDPDFVRG
ncbi:MAG: alpha/beta hydrolase [Actinomycetia bacterium]|nr:alpha/beta hydrolase [Actinomycetes bacterium]